MRDPASLVAAMFVFILSIGLAQVLLALAEVAGGIITMLSYASLALCAAFATLAVTRNHRQQVGGAVLVWVATLGLVFE